MSLRPVSPVSSYRLDLTKTLAIFVSYVAVAQLGFMLFNAPAVLTPVAGFGVAMLFLYGLRYAPVIFLAAATSYLLNDASPGMLLVLPFAHGLQAAAGAALLKVLGFDMLLSRLRDVLFLMLVSLTVSTIIPTFGLLARYINTSFYDRAFSSALTWNAWWVGMITSVLIVSPFVMRWVGKYSFGARTTLQWAEITAMLLIMAVVDYFIFWTTTTQIFGISLVYVLLAPFFWIALRIGPRFMTLALVLTATIGITGTFFGDAAPAAEMLGRRLFQVEVFLSIFAVIFFILVAVEEERKEAIRALSVRLTELRQALETLRSQDRIKSEFLAVLAHELRNPLAPLVSSLEILRMQRFVDERGIDTLNVMGNQLQRLRRLLDDLLDIARISQQKLTLQKEPVDINTVITNSLESVRSIIADRNQQLVVDTPAEIIMVEADATRLEQACVNLLNNASKFSAVGSSISLSVERDGGDVVVRVRDEGVGIDPEQLDHIFEPFRQGYSQGRNDGMGVGLTLAKNIMEMHGGTLRAHSEGTGKGSEFILSLPIVHAPGEPLLQETLGLENIGVHVGKHRILVVDDNGPAAQGIVTLLGIKGYLAEAASTGEEATQKMQSFEPHAAILDIGLPDVDGYTLARTLRSREKFTGLLIALSGYGQEEDKQKAREAGFDHHFTKPVGIAELHTVLAESL